MNPAARQVALLDAQAAGLADAPPPDPRAGRRHHRRHPRRRAPAAGRCPPADRGRSCCRASTPAMSDDGLGRAGRRAIRRPGSPACCAGWTRREATSGVWPRAAVTPRCPPGAARDAAPRAAARPAALTEWQDARHRRHRRPVAAARPPISRRRPRRSRWCCATRWKRRAPRAALVTPDRDLAGRVAAELLRYGVVADDSAGEPLADTPPAVFLRLLARAVAEDLAPVPLLALLKHPLAAAGLPPAACRAAARALELACLRGPRPSAGPDRPAPRARPRPRRSRRACDLLERLEACLEPALRIAASRGGRAGRGPGRADRGRRAPGRHRRAARARPAVGRRGRRGAGRPIWPRCWRRCRLLPDQRARACCRACWTPCWRAPSCAAAARCAGGTAPSIRACSSGGCSRRGCRPPTSWCSAAWPRASGRRRPIPAPGCRRPMRASGRPALARGDRRPGGARLRRLPPAPRRRWCCPARAGATARRRCRRAG